MGVIYTAPEAIPNPGAHESAVGMILESAASLETSGLRSCLVLGSYAVGAENIRSDIDVCVFGAEDLCEELEAVSRKVLEQTRVEVEVHFERLPVTSNVNVSPSYHNEVRKSPRRRTDGTELLVGCDPNMHLGGKTETVIPRHANAFLIARAIKIEHRLREDPLYLETRLKETRKALEFPKKFIMRKNDLAASGYDVSDLEEYEAASEAMETLKLFDNEATAITEKVQAGITTWSEYLATLKDIKSSAGKLYYGSLLETVSLIRRLN